MAESKIKGKIHVYYKFPKLYTKKRSGIDKQRQIRDKRGSYNEEQRFYQR